jgi:hypothetical protein
MKEFLQALAILFKIRGIGPAITRLTQPERHCESFGLNVK